MKKFALGFLLTAAMVLPGFSEANVGQPAPDFSAASSSGQTVKLSDYKGKYVVLEWTNYQCPFVKGQYDSGKMQAQQKKWTAQGVVWLTVCSSAEGKQGYLDAGATNQLLKDKGAAPTFSLLDTSGQVGHLYGAKTTPHMFVINPEGKVIYNGAIDDRKEKNYVDSALTEARAGQTVSADQTQPYGCGVKYSE
ncbi:MAG: redoxin domain-containing protein [Candidatus Eremiobacteraeota bacterium]|nr:redoxin domain-containing protein [Candidatus Eremiobacteraeota bacterium]MCW5868416.1 redoxin domain-containing protein [Candidatus Eremiobacteraeota bacterium]